VDVGDLSSGPAVIEGRTANRATRGLNFLSAETSLGAHASCNSSNSLNKSFFWRNPSRVYLSSDRKRNRSSAGPGPGSGSPRAAGDATTPNADRAGGGGGS